MLAKSFLLCKWKTLFHRLLISFTLFIYYSKQLPKQRTISGSDMICYDFVTLPMFVLITQKAHTP